MAENYDVTIVGGGMVGATLACALGGSGLRIAVVENREPEPFDPAVHDLRVSAVTRASQHIFETLDTWQGMASRRVCPFSRMRVWDGQSEGEAQFDSAHICEPVLGHIVENGVIQLALVERLKNYPNIDWLCPAAPESLDLDRRILTLTDGRALETRLVVGADGANSKIRALAGIDCHFHDYEQHALVATIETELPQQDITWQCHLPTGPQAFLPLTGHHASVIWYHSPEEIQRLKALDDERFARAVEQAFPERLGRVVSVQARGSFPLRRAHAERYAKAGLALAGDAAHVIHPHIGQGVNLGLLDAAALAELVLDSHRAGRNIGGVPVLRRYERWRRSNNVLLLGFSDAVYQAFVHQQTPLKLARNAMLNIAGRCTPINHLCMRYAMGMVGDLPRLARGQTIDSHPSSPATSHVA